MAPTMTYDYAVQRKELFTEHGTETLIAVRDTVNRLTKIAGAVRALEALAKATAETRSGHVDSWTGYAALDYMIERRELREITDASRVFEENRVFVAIEGGA